MPSEITPRPMPCSTRPTIIGISVSDSADTTEPSSRQTSSAKYIRRLPNMSPRRPLIGIEIDAASRVEVSTQEASAVFGVQQLGQPRDDRGDDRLHERGDEAAGGQHCEDRPVAGHPRQHPPFAECEDAPVVWGCFAHFATLRPRHSQDSQLRE